MTTNASDEPHLESAPTSGFIGQSAKAVAAYCLLPDPRPQGVGARVTRWFNGLLRPLNHQSESDCIARQIAGKAPIYNEQTPITGSSDYLHIMMHAKAFAKTDAALCKVRDFQDTRDEPQPYFGYRGADKQCHVTHDEAAALKARASYPQKR